MTALTISSLGHQIIGNCRNLPGWQFCQMTRFADMRQRIPIRQRSGTPLLAKARRPLWIPSHEPDPWATVGGVGVIDDAEAVLPIDRHVALRAR
jgi:hypothetical protein